MSVSRRPKPLRTVLSEQAPLLIALAVIALVIVFTRTRKADPSQKTSAPPTAASQEPSTPTEPEPIPEEPPLGPLRVDNAELPCDVDDVLARKCRRCHAIPPRHNAPFPLFTWADFQPLRGAQPIYEVVGRVVQSGFMPYPIPANPPVEPLTDEEKKTLLDWVTAGGPRGACKPTKHKKPPRPAPADKADTLTKQFGGSSSSNDSPAAR